MGKASQVHPQRKSEELLSETVPVKFPSSSLPGEQPITIIGKQLGMESEKRFRLLSSYSGLFLRLVVEICSSQEAHVFEMRCAGWIKIAKKWSEYRVKLKIAFQIDLISSV
ncbi:hypothetical protein AVEN_208795-1 [Araneus ventricosus]|uniref:Uncharacterized protein n=1 Tax=Araneus ventricosus TaxID=182803 RepID=A0A4Y2LIE0_ARAVE|nr:hypothetical protein AVEN_208795-1 [Araneus ventricosus]